MTTLNSRFQKSIILLNRIIASEIMKQMNSQITGTQMFMLYYIRESNRCRITELAEKMDVKPSAVTVMIDRLVKSNYVRRVDDTVDRRVIWVEVTVSGHEILKKAQIIREDIVGTYMSKLSDDEGRIATEILEKMVVIAQQSSS
ncbi:MarR family winged helix-turn-helix transcriptional regulator [Paenibacillus sp. L3-i20]|uniref:MarR family winged helix-turn-helix transcriptional regulator n=1 Tax=Paenibacillus sp. L3-i20 TaxID=2905833 RepID=UPI001EDD2245|nr:MarR family transcriptional regulator [Paenibacillus sp. L3-i20]GKU79201.1 putative HTH-type transcriptional regulator YusO [Paenibacillus sp. L3-i20]